MSAVSIAGLVLLGLAWLFFLYALVLHYALFWKAMKAGDSEYVPSSLGFIPGIVGALAVAFTLPQLAAHGIDAPWPWLWIALPLAIDPYCLPALILLLAKAVAGTRLR